MMNYLETAINVNTLTMVFAAIAAAAAHRNAGHTGQHRLGDRGDHGRVGIQGVSVRAIFRHNWLSVATGCIMPLFAVGLHRRQPPVGHRELPGGHVGQDPDLLGL